MKIFKIIARLLLAAFIVLAAYEAYRVTQAKMLTSDVKAQYLQHNPLPLDAISQERLEILLAVEDPNFFHHQGIDLSTPGAGITTITQGLAKFMYFDNFQPGFAKLEQSLIARFVLDKQFSKQQQLEVLYNHAYLGHVDGKRVSGFAEAAQVYYGVEYSELTDEQYLSLVAMLVGPNGFNVLNKPTQNRLRVERIQALLDGRYTPVGLTDVYYTAVK